MDAERSQPRLGAYVLPGPATDPKAVLDQARTAESFGLDVWIGERFDSKDLPALASAVGQVTRSARIGAALTVPFVRHPIVLASMGQTLQSLTGERFRLGLGRSAAWRWQAYGLPPPTLADLGGLADVLRRLWRGDTVDHDGPIGRFRGLRLAVRLDLAPPPLLLGAVGPKGVATAGTRFDGVILHPMLTPAAAARAADGLHAAAEQAGRDPYTVSCITTVVAAAVEPGPDGDDGVRARCTGYLAVPGLGEAIVRANGWDSATLERFRAQPALIGPDGQISGKHLSTPQLLDASTALPSEWFAEATIGGDAASQAARLHEYARSGADEIILHGSTPDRLAPLLDAARGDR